MKDGKKDHRILSKNYLWEGCTEIENRDGIFKLLRSPGIDSRAKNIV
jgi:hypothetical protein